MKCSGIYFVHLFVRYDVHVTMEFVLDAVVCVDVLNDMIHNFYIGIICSPETA